MPATSPAQALGLILHGPLKRANASIVLLNYRDPATFSALWLQGLESGKWMRRIDGTEQEEPIDLTDSTKQFLIIGNDPPDGIFDTKLPALAGINFRSHFTATSWLAAWRVRYPDSKTSIAVVDPRESLHAQGAGRSLQAILGAKDAKGNSLIPGATVLNSPSLTEICEWLGAAKDPKRTLPPETPSHLRELLKSTIWNDLTSDREQHHALSNVLGSFLLRAQVGRGSAHAGEPWVQDYLLALVRACGVEAGVEQIKVKHHVGVQRWVTPEQQKSIEAAVLIDDMAGLWDYFLRGALGFAGSDTLEGTGRSYRESFEVLAKDDFAKGIRELPGRLTSFFESRKACLGADVLLGTETRIAGDFVLFLDLRLFASSMSGKAGEEERAFQSEIAEFGRKLLGSRRNMPWVDQEGRNSLILELDRLVAPPEARIHSEPLNLPPTETILPRLIGLLDPTLPIVIFSSTHRTEFIEPFRNYGNIITNFHKPVLTGLAGDWSAMVREMHAEFLTAIDRAAAVLRVRRLLRPIQKPAVPY
jgi:hypothetical protein